MKQLIPYGPGTHPVLLLDDQKAEDAYQALKSGEAYEIVDKGKKISFRENAVWAIEIMDFGDDKEKCAIPPK